MPILECKFCKGVEPVESPAGWHSPATFSAAAPSDSKKPLRRMPGAARWKDYNILLLGHDYGHGYRDISPVLSGRDHGYSDLPPLPPVVNRKWLYWFQRIQHHTGSGQALLRWRLYNGYHVKHKSGWEMNIHWWPSHGFKFTVEGFNQKRDFDSLTQFLKLFKPETRGAPKITEEELARVIRKLGDKATQVKVAKELKTSDRTLRDWTAREGLSWEQVKHKHLTP